MTQNSSNEKWFHRKKTIILLLIFLHPIGLIGLWLRRETKIWKKIIATIPLSVYLLGVLLMLLPSPKYDLALNEINKKHFLIAYNYLSEIEKSDENYNKSQLKLNEIIDLATKEAESILVIIDNNYNETNHLIIKKEFDNAKDIAKNTFKQYEKIEAIYPEKVQDSIYTYFNLIRKLKPEKIAPYIDSLNNRKYISGIFNTLLPKHVIALKQETLTFNKFDNAVLNHILVLKLQDYLTEQIEIITDNEFLKEKIGKLSEKQYNELSKGLLDTNFLSSNALNMFLLKEMEKNMNLRKEFLLEEKVKLEYERKAAREKSIISQFSVWDGSHSQLKKYIKQQMNDPGSFDHVKTTYSDHGSYILVKMKFRGKNAFGAIVLQVVECKATISGDRLYDIITY